MRLSELLRRLFGQRGRLARGETVRAESAPDEWEDVDPFNPFPEPVRIEIRDEFDLHSIKPRDVHRVVEEYLYEARLAGFPVVRIIHGKGVGVQREIVRQILARTPFVEHFMDAPENAGGWGATIARLAPREREKGAEGQNRLR